jgi:hypothetical protein
MMGSQRGLPATFVDAAGGVYPDIAPLSNAQHDAINQLHAEVAKLYRSVNECARCIHANALPLSLCELTRIQRHLTLMLENIDALEFLDNVALARSGR